MPRRSSVGTPWFLVFLVVAACDDERATSDASLDVFVEDARETTEDIEPARNSPAIAGYDLSPNAGDFWEYLRTEVWNGVETPMGFRYTLENPVTQTIDGLTYEVFDVRAEPLDWTHWDPDSPGFEQIWTRLAFGNDRILGFDVSGASGEPNHWGVIFDAWNGAWPSNSGFFGYERGGVIRPSPSIWGGQAAHVITQSGFSSNDCEYLPGYGQVCGNIDPLESFNLTEYYAPGVGLTYEEFTGCTSGGCLDVIHELTAWRIGANVSPGCAGCVPSTESSNELCRDGVDNDGDTYVDCTDFDCSRNAQVTVCGENTNAACSDGVDNDGDAYIDCADFDCSRNTQLSVCSENTNATCSDGLDNDGDSFVDCVDFDCSQNTSVTVCP